MNQKVIAKPKGAILFTLFFCLIVIFGLSILFYTKSDTRVFVLLFISFILYGIYDLVKRFTYLKVEKDYIKYGLNARYSYSQIRSVKLYDLKDYRFLFFPMREECLTVVFEDGKKIKLEDNYYKNLWKIRWVLENKIIKNNNSFNFHFNTDFDCDQITNKTTKISTFVKLTPYLLYFFLLSLITNIPLIYYDIYTNGPFVVVSVLGLMALLLFSGKSYYMESCDNGIFIKNLVFKHVKVKIPLNQIEYIRLKKVGGGRNKAIFLVIHMNYHKDYQFAIDFINFDRTENIMNQVKKLNINFHDLR
ncbi:hypothetical protein AAG747_05045 [Rapidithrix thailandica]|uniref:Uncharacterized protein n=1 Tax=Rapidithrix thailandica TaxID=413964 RepID=A0AAW9RUF1_9BACT